MVKSRLEDRVVWLVVEGDLRADEFIQLFHKKAS